jgi:hypothetical protein
VGLLFFEESGSAERGRRQGTPLPAGGLGTNGCRCPQEEWVFSGGFI